MLQFCSNISAPGQAHPVLSSSHKSILLRDTTTITARSGLELSICSPSGTKTAFSFQPRSLSMLSLWFYLGIFPDAHSNLFSYSCLKFSSFFFGVQDHNLFFLLAFFLDQLLWEKLPKKPWEYLGSPVERPMWWGIKAFCPQWEMRYLPIAMWEPS